MENDLADMCAGCEIMEEALRILMDVYFSHLCICLKQCVQSFDLY